MWEEKAGVLRSMRPHSVQGFKVGMAWGRGWTQEAVHPKLSVRVLLLVNFTQLGLRLLGSSDSWSALWSTLYQHAC